MQEQLPLQPLSVDDETLYPFTVTPAVVDPKSGHFDPDEPLGFGYRGGSVQMYPWESEAYPNAYSQRLPQRCFILRAIGLTDAETARVVGRTKACVTFHTRRVCNELGINVGTVNRGVSIMGHGITQAFEGSTLKLARKAKEPELPPKLRMVLAGSDPREQAEKVAESLSMQLSTLRSHRLRLHRELGVRCNAGLVTISYMCGMLSLSSPEEAALQANPE